MTEQYSRARHVPAFVDFAAARLTVCGWMLCAGVCAPMHVH